jgi:3-hydroxy-9,10-secoandrosta-1,3,5(10)-triene-9,17-dione monooxygenase
VTGTATPAETRRVLLGRAAGLVPALRERAAATEEARQVLPETLADLHRLGLLRAGVPVRFGGLDVPPGTMFEIGEELARGCPSTGWCYGNWVIHQWWIGHFPEQAQADYFAQGPDVLNSSSVNQREGTAEPVPGGYRVSGHWTYSSGCDGAAWAVLAAVTPTGMTWVLMPRSDWQIEDHWFVSGMRGTGSKDIVAHDVFVPAHRTLDPDAAGVTEFRGWELHRNPGYRVPSRLFNGWAISGPIMGMARGALEVFTDRYSAIKGAPRAADAVSLQLRVAEAAAEVAAAQALHRACVAQMLDTAAAGGSFTAVERAALMRDKAYIVKLSVQAVNRLFEASGGRGTHDRDPMQRFHRDIHAASHHVQLQWDTMAEDYGRQALGLEPKGPR